MKNIHSEIVETCMREMLIHKYYTVVLNLLKPTGYVMHQQV